MDLIKQKNAWLLILVRIVLIGFLGIYSFYIYGSLFCGMVGSVSQITSACHMIISSAPLLFFLNGAFIFILILIRKNIIIIISLLYLVFSFTSIHLLSNHLNIVDQRKQEHAAQMKGKDSLERYNQAMASYFEHEDDQNLTECRLYEMDRAEKKINSSVPELADTYVFGLECEQGQFTYLFKKGVPDKILYKKIPRGVKLQFYMSKHFLTEPFVDKKVQAYVLPYLDLNGGYHQGSIIKKIYKDNKWVDFRSYTESILGQNSYNDPFLD